LAEEKNNNTRVYKQRANKGKQRSVIQCDYRFHRSIRLKTTSQYYLHNYIPTVQQRNFIKDIPQFSSDRAVANLPCIYKCTATRLRYGFQSIAGWPSRIVCIILQNRIIEFRKKKRWRNRCQDTWPH
jgi:hypothetical protein